MEKHDVIVIGAGLAGLSATRDLINAGTDALLIEARDRPGGRVEQTLTSDGRRVQLGGEIVGSFHTEYKQLVTELGLTLVPTFVASTGRTSWLIGRETTTGEHYPWMGPSDQKLYDQIEDEFSRLAASVDPDDPWSHPQAAQLDKISVADWVRSAGGTPPVLRALELSAKALSVESIERTSLLADLRKESAAGADGFYNYEAWENERVLEGSATVAMKMAEEVDSHIRYKSPVKSIQIDGSHNVVHLTTGEAFEASAIVSALPVGPLRDIQISGVSTERLTSLHRQRHAPAVKLAAVYPTSFWEVDGLNGTAYMEPTLLGGTWAQNDGMLSGLIPPSSLGEYFATAPELRQSELTQELEATFGQGARNYHQFFLRNWASDPWTQGYVTGWRPGDVMSVGPLHGTHEPPFYICGSDQWVCGYMEGAVRTGRSAATEVLRDRQ